jgi:hypothetical protein
MRMSSLIFGRCRDSAVSMATGYGLDYRGDGFRVPVESRIFSSTSRTDRSCDPTIQWVQDSLSPRVKRQGREADHSPPTSAEMKKMWIYTSTLPIRLLGLVLY